MRKKVRKWRHKRREAASKWRRHSWESWEILQRIKLSKIKIIIIFVTDYKKYLRQSYLHKNIVLESALHSASNSVIGNSLKKFLKKLRFFKQKNYSQFL